jgi:hypothetical protein
MTRVLKPQAATWGFSFLPESFRHSIRSRTGASLYLGASPPDPPGFLRHESLSSDELKAGARQT